MDYSLNKDNPVVRLRAFRAIDDPATCNLFIEGHTHVLTSIGVNKLTSSKHDWMFNPAAFALVVESIDGKKVYGGARVHVLTSIGITKVTSSKNDWMYNPAAFVLVVESLDEKKVYGGARVHVAGGNQPLPIEQAASALDPLVFDLVWKYAQQGTGELCGLWNSREIAGYGVGSIFLIRAAVAISQQLGIKSLFAFCAPYTIKPVSNCGLELETSIGNDGTFLYPKLDLIATTMLLKDVDTLTKAEEEDKNAIIKLRKNLNIVKKEELRKKEITIHYETLIPLLNRWDLSNAINEAYESNQRSKSSPAENINFNFL